MPDLENVRFAFVSCFYLVYQLIYKYFRFQWPPSLISPLFLTSDSVRNGNVGMPDHENMVFAFGILFLSGLQAKIYVPPV